MTNAILSFLEGNDVGPGREVTLVGESCGALFAVHAALRSNKKKEGRVSRVVLVNPATSFEQTGWSTLGRAVAASGPLFPAVGLATLMATAIEFQQVRTIGQKIASRISSVESLTAELNALLAAGSQVTKLLPADTLTWRLAQWLERGSALVAPRLDELTTPTLVLVGQSDRLLPSREEGKRLNQILQRAEVKVFPGSGHALLDGSVDLAKEMRLARVFRPRYDGIKPKGSDLRDTSYLEFPVPSEEELEEFDRSFGIAQRLFSPVFLSVDPASGKVAPTLEHVPSGRSGRPVLFVGNHQLFGGDLGLLLREFIKSKQTLLRGLAHPMVFSQQGGFGGGGGGGQEGDQKSLFLQFGAVQVSPFALNDLLSRNESVLLFPGGVGEAFGGRADSLAYKVMWPQKSDFVRMAALHGALIVPFGAVGMADSATFLLDPEEVRSLPFGLGERASEQSGRMPQARAGGTESMIAPLVTPGLPQRNYFLFQPAIDTAALDFTDREACRLVYEETRRSVEKSIETLLEYRSKDPWSNTLTRLVYESVTSAPAPHSR